MSWKKMNNLDIFCSKPLALYNGTWVKLKALGKWLIRCCVWELVREETERKRKRERERCTTTLNQTVRVQSIIKEKSHKFQHRLFIRSCPNLTILFCVWVNCCIHWSYFLRYFSFIRHFFISPHYLVRIKYINYH